MLPIEMQLQRFFIEQGGHYTNHHGIEFLYIPEDNSLFLSCDVPGFYVQDFDITLDLNTSHNNLYHFVQDYSVTELADLKSITPQLLFKRFQVGRAVLSCSIDADLEEYVNFSRKGAELWAKDNKDQEHPVPACFSTPAELLTYTQHYYERKPCERI